MYPQSVSAFNTYYNGPLYDFLMTLFTAIGLGCMFLGSLFIFLSFRIIVFPPPILYLRRHRGGTRGVHLAVTCGRHNCQRGEDVYRSWAKQFIEEESDSTLIFVMSGHNSILKEYSISIKRKVKGFREVLDIDFLALEDFLATEHQWHIRTTYDCFVNLKNLKKLITQLNTFFDPNEIIIKGQVLWHRSDIIFIHGGSGWILSRKAAVEMMKSKNHLIELYNQHSSWGDDVLMDEFARKICKLNVSEIHDQRFMGSPTYEHQLRQLVNQSYKFEDCTKSSLPSIDDLVFWHVGSGHNLQLLHGNQIMAQVPHNVKIVGLHHYSYLCIDKGIS